VDEARANQVLDERVISLEDSLKELQASLHPEELRKAWGRAAASVARTFSELWNESGEGRDRLLLLDNVDVVADQEIGVWLGDLLSTWPLSDTTVVLTRDANHEGLNVPADVARPHKVENFSEAQVQEYLTDATSRSVPVSWDLATKVHAVTGGHPGTLRIVYDLLWGAGVVQVTDPTSMLAGLPEQPEEKVAALVERLVAQRPEPALMEWVKAAAVPRRFDVQLLNHLVDAPEEQSHFGVLRDLSFVEAQNETASELRIHPFVRRSLLWRMGVFEKKKLHDLHDKAARFFYAQRMVGKPERQGQRKYGDWYVYEDPGWQAAKLEWLYHLGHVQDPVRRREAILSFATVFLDAWWWWGNYVHFDFLDQLLADLRRVLSQEASVDGGPSAFMPAGTMDSWRDLTTLYHSLTEALDAYPLRSGKGQDADWDSIRDAALLLADASGLSLLVDDGWNEEQRHLAALVCLLLAHTYRYQDPLSEDADHFYERAEDLFEPLDDDEETGDAWGRAWVQFERADLAYGQGLAEQSQDHWDRSARYAQPPPRQRGFSTDTDDELVANLQRLRGDMLWKTDPRRAARHYALSVVHAYLFHFGGKKPPDEYTMQFYVDIRARALSRIRELWPKNEQDTLSVAAEIFRTVWAAFGQSNDWNEDKVRTALAGGRVTSLAHSFVPRGPSVNEIVGPIFDATRDRQLGANSAFAKEFTLLRTRANNKELTQDLRWEQLRASGKAP